MLHLRHLGIAQVLCLQHIREGPEVLHLKDLHCSKIVQNVPISAGGNELPQLLDLCSKGARRSCRRDSEESSGKKRDGRIGECPFRQGRNLPDEIGTGRSTRDACSGCASLMDARLGGRLMWLASSSYKSVAQPALTVNNYYCIDIIRMEL